MSWSLWPFWPWARGLEKKVSIGMTFHAFRPEQKKEFIFLLRLSD